MARSKTTPASIDRSLYDPSLLAGMDGFLKTVAARFSPTTVTKRRSCLQRFIHYLHEAGITRYQDVSTDTILAYHRQLIDQGYSSHSVYAYLSSIRLLYRHLAQESLLFENPTRHLTLAKPPQELGLVLNEDQIKALLRQPDITQPLGIRDRALIELLYATGIRLGECANLTIFDLDLDNQTIKVIGKGRKERILPIGSHAAKHLQLYIKQARPKLIRDNDPPEELWLSYRRARPLGAGNIRLVVQRHARAADLPKQTDTHTLRRTCASHLLRGGAHPVAVAHLLGHANLATLAYYLKTTITDLKKTHAKSAPGK